MVLLTKYKEHKANTKYSKICILIMVMSNAAQYISTFLQETKVKVTN